MATRHARIYDGLYYTILLLPSVNLNDIPSYLFPRSLSSSRWFLDSPNSHITLSPLFATMLDQRKMQIFPFYFSLYSSENTLIPNEARWQLFHGVSLNSTNQVVQATPQVPFS